MSLSKTFSVQVEAASQEPPMPTLSNQALAGPRLAPPTSEPQPVNDALARAEADLSRVVDAGLERSESLRYRWIRKRRRHSGDALFPRWNLNFD